MTISDEAVNAAALAIRKADDATFDSSDDSEPTLTKLGALELARVALEAAAPHILASALAPTWDSGFTACARQFAKQADDPNYAIARNNPHADPRA